MGRKKKAPVSERVIWVYLKTPQIAQEWKDAAKESDALSTSAFIKEIVEEHLSKKGKITPRKSLEEQLETTKKENKELKRNNIELSKKIDRKNVLLDRYEEQIRDYEMAEQNKWIDEKEGIKKYKQSLIKLLKKEENVKKEKILDKLNISPDNRQAIRAISKQLETLTDYGLLTKYRGGYKWQG